MLGGPQPGPGSAFGLLARWPGRIIYRLCALVSGLRIVAGMQFKNTQDGRNRAQHRASFKGVSCWPQPPGDPAAVGAASPGGGGAGGGRHLRPRLSPARTGCRLRR